MGAENKVEIGDNPTIIVKEMTQKEKVALEFKTEVVSLINIEREKVGAKPIYIR